MDGSFLLILFRLWLFRYTSCCQSRSMRFSLRFLEKKLMNMWPLVFIGVYSFLALGVFVLYLRCTAIDPADPCMLIEPVRASPNRPHNGSEVPGNASSVGDPSKTGFQNGGIYDNGNSGCCSKVAGVVCGCIVKEDCRNDEEMQLGGEEEAIFCTLCNAEVRVSLANTAEVVINVLTGSIIIVGG